MISGHKRSVVVLVTLGACWLGACFAPPDDVVDEEAGSAKLAPATPDKASASSAAGRVTVQSVAIDGSELIRPEFADAGVCARCHVNIVLEWGISLHKDVGTSCQECHGPSADHVENERNEVKPDRIPRGAQIASLCSTCHEDGCPSTEDTADCQSCHHVHALIKVNPEGEQEVVEDDERDRAAFDLFVEYSREIDLGEQLVKSERWDEARAAFTRALQIRPGDTVVQSRLEFVMRRSQPDLPGFQTISSEFDPEVGLPVQVKVAEIDLSMVLIPGGEFDLGDDRLADAQPVHTVSVEPFYLATFEITQDQWVSIMGENPSHHQGELHPDARRLPVERVSWHRAQAFVERLNQRVAGGGFRLPTEAEWEYACRAGAPTSTIDVTLGTLEEVAWFNNNSLLPPEKRDAEQEVDNRSPRPVGTRQANTWGLHDMLGNVWEWCSSPYRPYLEVATTPEPNSLRVLRGGGYVDVTSLLRPTLRYAGRPSHAFRWVGLRVARSVPPLAQ